jgi:hypothetical protein
MYNQQEEVKTRDREVIFSSLVTVQTLNKFGNFVQKSFSKTHILSASLIAFIIHPRKVSLFPALSEAERGKERNQRRRRVFMQ